MGIGALLGWKQAQPDAREAFPGIPDNLAEQLNTYGLHSKEKFSADEAVLDVGGKEGNLVDWLVTNNLASAASRSMDIEDAHRTKRPLNVTGDAYAMSQFGDNTFHKVLSFGSVLTFLMNGKEPRQSLEEDVITVLREMIRVCAAGGKVYVPFNTKSISMMPAVEPNIERLVKVLHSLQEDDGVAIEWYPKNGGFGQYRMKTLVISKPASTEEQLAMRGFKKGAMVRVTPVDFDDETKALSSRTDGRGQAFTGPLQEDIRTGAPVLCGNFTTIHPMVEVSGQEKGVVYVRTQESPELSHYYRIELNPKSGWDYA